jgi:hypothetical protein
MIVPVVVPCGLCVVVERTWFENRTV